LNLEQNISRPAIRMLILEKDSLAKT